MIILHRGGVAASHSDWGVPPIGWTCSVSHIHWGAFFGDVQQEVVPVTSGHRITLLKSLLHFNTTTDSIFLHWHDHQSLVFRTNGCIKTSSLYEGSGILVFFCQHKYVAILDPSTIELNLANCLKGEDAVMYQIVILLGLSVDMKPILCQKKRISQNNKIVARKFKHD